MARIIDAFTQFFDGAGDPLIDGKLKFTVSGSSTVDKDTFSDIAESANKKNANPLILTAAGRVPNNFGTGTYRVTLLTSDDVQIAQFDPVGGDVATGFGSQWDAPQIYGITDVVRFNNLYYQSLVNANQGNQPDTSPSFWKQTSFLDLEIGTDVGDLVARAITASGNLILSSDIETGNSDNLILALSNGDIVLPGNISLGGNINANVFIGDGSQLTGISADQVDKQLWPTFKLGTDALHDIDFEAGKILDSTGATVLDLTSTLTKQLDVAWVPGNNVGGAVGGVLGANETRHLFLIEKDSDQSIDCMADVDINAANIPVGWTKFRRIHSIITKPSLAEIEPVIQNGDQILLDVMIRDFSGTTIITASLVTLSIPQGLKLQVNGVALLSRNTGAVDTLVTSPDQTDTAPSGSFLTLFVPNIVSALDMISYSVWTNTVGQVRHRSDFTSALLQLFTHGWTDERIV